MSKLTEWFIKNTKAANLLMLLIIIGGLNALPGMDKEFFPSRKINDINISMVYPGASPREVEQQISKRIEEAIHDLDGIDKLRSVSREGLATVIVETEAGYDGQVLLNDVKSKVDAILTFPVEAERPQVNLIQWKVRMISLSLEGDIGEANLKELGIRLRDELSEQPHVSLVELRKPRAYEMSIEVREQDLRRYGLRFEDIANAVRRSSLNLPAGKLKTTEGDIQLQARGQAYTIADFEDIVVRSDRSGVLLTLNDVANIKAVFEDSDSITRFDQKPSLSLDVYSTSKPNVLKTSESVEAFLARVTPQLPQGVELTIWRDMSISYKGRINTLITNGLGGLLLVFIVLLLFLRPLLAFWVSIGIGVAFLGAFWLLPTTGASLNMISLFAFLLILGIVVDDAIIVGESIYSAQSSGQPGMLGAIEGTRRVITPVWFAVISTMIFFAPFFFLPGDGPEPAEIPKVVLLALAFSLIESMFILPSHLAHMRPEKPARSSIGRVVDNVRGYCSSKMEIFSKNHYQRFLSMLLRWKLLTISVFFIGFMLTVGVLSGGWMKVAFFPRVPVDFMSASVELADGVAFADTESVMLQLEDAAYRMEKKYNSDEKKLISHVESVAYGSTVRVVVGFESSETRDIDLEDMVTEWKAEIGHINRAKDFNISFTILNVGKPIEMQITARTIDSLKAVSEALQQELGQYPGVYNVRTTLDDAKPEIVLGLKPKAKTLGLTLSDVAEQVRQGFYGEEVQRIPLANEDVKVMVRYPRDIRDTEDYLRDMWIRTPQGVEIPFEQVASVEYQPSYTTIERIDRKRSARVSAELQFGYANAGEIIAAIKQSKIAEWKRQYPDVTFSLEGEQANQADFVGATFELMALSMVIIFGLMAVVFKSYWQPLVVLTAVPFGFMGSIIGHLMMGVDISMFSMMGIIACAGVVVNDNLVLIDRVNTLHKGENMPLEQAIATAGPDRFRAIVLTSATTFIGLLPIMTETSLQAQFLIPMVISLAFGVLLASFVTLLLVPCLLLSGEHMNQWLAVKKRRLAALVNH
ncbi:Efflux pump membrane transporter BepG [Sinobacterium norvegicum]|uniref:Efflux pump membrane transporter BepG n=1 Tax=Sinobacterium norvegicum TaxID=1641715 RepID=A0ABN8ELR5_9GAMM|nr:efflux RND transporter permease subunit [Sinobacterium norvegicum]CAH0991822.1 Efflux pump membrane transporter BepG [Sinobacterium norvegicum]